MPSPAPFVLRLLAIGGLCVLLTGCATSSRPPLTAPKASEECGRLGTLYLPAPRLAQDALGSQSTWAAGSPLSKRGTRTAHTIGVLPLVQQWTALSQQNPAPELAQLMLRQRIMDRITLTGFEVSSVLAELNCEDERNDQLRDRLLSQENERLRNLTVAGMVIGAVTAIGTGGLSLANQANAANVVSLIGGVSEVGVGIAALNDDMQGELKHRRNLLADVWFGTGDKGTFPPVVWNYLNTRPSSTRPTVRENLINLWKDSGRLGAEGSEQEQQRTALLFGEGGSYNASQLKTRETLLDLLEAHVALLNQDLAELMTELLLFMENPAASTKGVLDNL